MSAPDTANPGTAPGASGHILSPESIQAIAAAVAGATNPGVTILGELKEEIASPKPSLARKLAPRMLGCLLLAAVLAAVVCLIAPQQVSVGAFKLLQVSIGCYLGYWMDRWLFPYARPDGYLVSADWNAEAAAKGSVQGDANHGVAPGYELIFAVSMLRRALVMLAVTLGVGLGL